MSNKMGENEEEVSERGEGGRRRHSLPVSFSSRTAFLETLATQSNYCQLYC